MKTKWELVSGIFASYGIYPPKKRGWFRIALSESRNLNSNDYRKLLNQVGWESLI